MTAEFLDSKWNLRWVVSRFRMEGCTEVEGTPRSRRNRNGRMNDTGTSYLLRTWRFKKILYFTYVCLGSPIPSSMMYVCMLCVVHSKAHLVKQKQSKVATSGLVFGSGNFGKGPAKATAERTKNEPDAAIVLQSQLSFICPWRRPLLRCCTHFRRDLDGWMDGWMYHFGYYQPTASLSTKRHSQEELA